MGKKTLISNIKEQIKKRMEAKNLSSYSLEKVAGLGRGIVGNIVYDKSKSPRIDTLQAIAEALDCGVDDLLLDDFIAKSTSHKFIASLFIEIVNEVLSCLKAKNCYLSLNEVIQLIQESYIYCLTSKNGQIDKEFIEWFIDTNTRDS